MSNEHKLEMADVVKAHLDVPGCPVLTSNQCHAIAMKLNALLSSAPQPPALGGESIRAAAKKWFYESFDCDLLEKMEKHNLIAQAEGFSVSVMVDLELELEKAFSAHIAPLQAEIERWKAISAAQKDRMDVALELAKEHREERDHLKARRDELEGLLGQIRQSCWTSQFHDAIDAALSKSAGSEKV